MSDIVTIRHTGICGYDLIGPDGKIFAWASESFTRPQTTVKRPEAPAKNPEVASTTKTLCGPFVTRPVTPTEHEIVNADGTTAVRVVGSDNADFLMKLLSLAHKHGKV